MNQRTVHRAVSCEVGGERRPSATDPWKTPALPLPRPRA